MKKFYGACCDGDGNVDHGKTSLLDYIREAKVAPVKPVVSPAYWCISCGTDHGEITFLDTLVTRPSAMRARGAV